MDAKIGALLASFVILFAAIVFVSADPTGPDTINITSNETMNTSGAGTMVNISGGYLAKMNISATIQNPHWKAFIGWIQGSFTLDDSTGATIYDWSASSTSGEVYATRASGTINWSAIDCANSTHINAEDVAMDHTGDDNISSTFIPLNNTYTYIVAGTTIDPNNCSSLNTYEDNATQTVTFEEIILYDEADIVYATKIESAATGYDGQNYDFQMLIPENGNESFIGATAYYLYVELN